MHMSHTCARPLMWSLLLLLLPVPVLAQTGSVAGLVVAEQTEVGLQAGPTGLTAVQVDALLPDGRSAGMVLTDQEGAFRIFLEPGTYELVFSVPGWETHREAGVVVRAGETTRLRVALAERAFELDPVTITASKTEEKVSEAPAAVQVVGVRDIQEQPAVTVAEHVKAIAAVDVIKTGLQSNYVVVRGFNNIFSGATLTLTDNRIARVPSLRANILYMNPTTNLDLERIEVVLGPGSALYGPNATNGVIHSITKSPIDYPGGTISVGTGVRQQGAASSSIMVDLDGDRAPETEVTRSHEASNESVTQVEGRYALRLSDRFGVKLSGQYFTGTEFNFIDPGESGDRARARRCIEIGMNPNVFPCTTFTQGLTGSAEDLELFQESVQNVDRGRNQDLERYSFDLRADWRPRSDLSLIVSGGRTQTPSSVDLTGLGAGQVVDWGYNYGQVRALWKEVFAQVFFNKSDNTDTYLLGTGRPLVDESSLLVAQIQNQSSLLGSEFIYGLDLLRTVPQTAGTINGQNEDDDEITEFGGYVQSETPLTDRLELMLAGRVDHHSRLENPVFSPRAALVFEPAQGQSFRATYNRAFSTPSTLNMFLDISGRTIPLGGPFRYDIRAQGVTEDGLQFSYTNGVPDHVTPFGLLVGTGIREYRETTAPNLWAVARAVLPNVDTTAARIFSSVPVPAAGGVDIDARTLNTTTQTFDPTPGGLSGIQDIPTLNPTITNTFELGYKGLIGDRLLLGANGYYSLIDDFTSALRIVSPNVFLNTASVQQYLIDNGVAPAEAAYAAAVVGGTGSAAAPGLPLGVVTPTEAGGTESALVLTYQNLGRVELFGFDASATLVLNDVWQLDLGGAWISDDQFVANEGEVDEEVIPLNAPTLKGTAGVRYRNVDNGFRGQLRGRYVNGFPANSGVYSGDVDGYSVFDVTLGYQVLDNASLTLDVQNLLDTDYQTFVGAPPLGRFALLRLQYEF